LGCPDTDGADAQTINEEDLRTAARVLGLALGLFAAPPAHEKRLDK